jgi:hydroxymethylglutaryl-CoA lyase
MNTAHDRVMIQEVAPRDGLQIEPQWLETSDKVALIDLLSETGVTRIEVSSFVSPKAIPMLRDAAEVFARIKRNPDVIYVALVPNLRGAERAMAANADELNMVVSASETHNRANMRMTPEESVAGFRQIIAAHAGSRSSLNGTVATSFGCPFEGPQAPERILSFVKTYLDLGVQGITLADTTGMANPRQVGALVRQVLGLVPASALTLHFHNTRGMGLANVLAAYDAGARRFDAAVGGLGGCPFAPGATGNISTEDLVNMLDEMAIPCGADLSKLIAISRTLPGLLKHEMPGQVAKAGRNCDLHPKPEF